MTVLETAIIFENETLIEKSFYDTDEIIDKNARSNLLSAISVLASDSFSKEIESFSMGDHHLLTESREISRPDNPNAISSIKIYSIIQDDTNEKAVRRCMVDAITEFLNWYPLVHIFTKNKEMFEKFPDRLYGIFKDLCLNCEDRFKSIF